MLVSKLLFDLSQEADWNLQFTFLKIFKYFFKNILDWGGAENWVT